MKHLTFDESVRLRAAWNEQCAREFGVFPGFVASGTPPVVNSNPERVAPQGADGQGVCIYVQPDVSELIDAVILGSIRDCADGQDYAFGSYAGGYWLDSQFGWAAWPDAAGLMRGLFHATTGQSLHVRVCP